ncbi:MAG: NUDIX domain-containing protein [Rikenellaceae bacterium]
MEICAFFKDFHHCPKCGGEFIDNNVKSKRCEECGFVYYFNPSAAVAAIIRDDSGKILVSTRAHDPAKGTLDLPGGFVDSYESAEQSVVREVMEECSVEVTEIKYLFSLPNIYNYSRFNVHTLDLFFECRVADLSPLKAADDVASLQLIAPEDIDTAQFGLDSVRSAMERYLSELL